MRRRLAVAAAVGLIGLCAAAALAQQDQPAPPAQPDTTTQPDTSQPDTTQPGNGPADEANPPQVPPDTQGTQDQTATAPAAKPKPAKPAAASATAPGAPAPAAGANAPSADQTAAVPPVPTGPPQVPANAVLLMTGLDKITGRPTQITAPLNVPVHFATLTITARYCYSTPPSETPETSAFVQIEDHRPDKPARRIFSGWMYASSPGLNGMQHPLYDVWVNSCSTSAPGQVASVHAPSHVPVKVGSPDATDSEGVTALPEGSGQ